MIKTPSKQLTLSSSKRSISKNSILNSKSSLTKQSIKKIKKENEDSIDCKYCKSSFHFKEILNHLEFKCEFFTKAPVQKKTFSKEEREKLSKVNFNSAQTPFTEKVDENYCACVMNEHKDLVLASALAKEYRPSNKPILIKEIDLPDLSIGQVPLKSNLFCSFSLILKGKTLKNYLAYRIENKNIEIFDLADNTIAAVLTGHKDNITEIKYFKRDELNLLYSSSYDEYVFVWNINDFTVYKTFNYKSWALTSIIYYIDDKYYIAIGGGFVKNYPIQVFDLDSEVSISTIQLKENTNVTLMTTYNSDKRNFLICATDTEKPLILIYNYIHTYSLYKVYTLQCAVTSMFIFSTRCAHISLYTSDYSGTICEYNILKQTKIHEYTPSTSSLDLLLWDDYYLVTCGEKSGNILFLLRQKHRKYKTYTGFHQKVILNIQKAYINGIGNCLITLSSDKKIKLFRI